MFSKKDIQVRQSDKTRDQKIINQAKLFHKVIAKIDSIIGGFDEAKVSIKTVADKNKKIKHLLE